MIERAASTGSAESNFKIRIDRQSRKEPAKFYLYVSCLNTAKTDEFQVKDTPEGRREQPNSPSLVVRATVRPVPGKVCVRNRQRYPDNMWVLGSTGAMKHLGWPQRGWQYNPTHRRHVWHMNPDSIGRRTPLIDRQQVEPTVPFVFCCTWDK